MVDPRDTAPARRRPPGEEQERRGGTQLAVLALLASIAGSVGFIVAYQVDAGTQVLGATLALALAGIGAGLAWWSRRTMPQGEVVEDRPQLAAPPAEREQAAGTVEAGRQSVHRRGLLGGLLATALGALGLGALWPARSLGPRPSSWIGDTDWDVGVHLVDETGNRVTADALEPGGVLTVFPELSDPQAVEWGADDQVVLLRLDVDDLRLPAGRETWTPGGYVAYSKVCTHAGCPVGLYQTVGYLLLCPCHQATFDAIRGAAPVFGPAPRALPQLPLAVAEDGTLVAGGAFSGPVGPGRWRIGPEDLEPALEPEVDPDDTEDEG